MSIAAITSSIFDALSYVDPYDEAGMGDLLDAVNAYTRHKMSLKFTRMPFMGYFRQIMPPIPLYSLAEAQRLGIPYREDQIVTDERGQWVCDKYDTGYVYYQISEDVVTQEDFQYRLERGRVKRDEYRRWRRLQRRLAKAEKRRQVEDPQAPSIAERYDHFHGVMAGIMHQAQMCGLKNGFVERGRELRIGDRFRTKGNPYVYTKTREIQTLSGDTVNCVEPISGQFAYVGEDEEVQHMGTTVPIVPEWFTNRRPGWRVS